jgi:predicted nucleic acid-binding protein
MPRSVLIDAGPIVAYLRRDDEFHDWASLQFDQFPEFATCDAVLAEACARLNYFGLAQSWVVDLLVAKVLRVDFDTNQEAGRVARLMKKYADFEMDFADACLVAMTEKAADALVVTLDAKDFSVYRRHERQVVPFLSPRR